MPCVRRLSLLSRFLFPLAQQSVNAGAVLPHRAGLLQPIQLPHRLLEVEAEKLFLDVTQLALHFVFVESPQFICFHAPNSASSRLMNFVLMGSLWAASRMAASAILRSTPSISNKTLPGRTTATHCS